MRYALRVISFATRIVSALAVVAALVWMAVPGVVMASANLAHVEGEACPCCDGQAALGAIVACPGCQAGTQAGNTLSIPFRTVTAAWLSDAADAVTGIDLRPAEPPPR